jgi:hypothetical protein
MPRPIPLRSTVALAVALACLALLGASGRAGLGTDAALGARRAPHQPARSTLGLRVDLVRGRQILATGKAHPVPARGRVVLQINRGGKWRKLGQSPLVGHGEFSVRAVVSGAAVTVRLRAALYEGKRRHGVSPVRSIRLAAAGHLGHRAHRTTPTPAGPPAPTPSATPEDPLSAASLMATVGRYSSLPNHLSGTADGAAALDEFSASLAAAGLRTGEQAFTFPRFSPTAVGLTVEGTPVPSAALAPLLYSGTTPSGGTESGLFYAGEGTADHSFTEAQVAGKIVVVATPFPNNAKEVGLYEAIERAVELHAAGLVSVSQVVGGYPKWEDTNARDGTGPLPVLMVGKVSGAAVIAAAKAGKKATLTLAADTSGTSCSRDVWGELEGADPSRRVFVGVPATSYTPSASEHGTGVAITLGLARHYAALPKSQRPESLVFIALGGHEIGWLGLQALLNGPDGAWLKEADAYVHLGSALGAPKAEETPFGSGQIVTSSQPDPTGRLHDSENRFLEGSVIEDFAAAGVPTPETPPSTASGGEQTNAYAAGIPTASFSGASLFFHTAGDTPSTIDQSILTRQADAFRRVVDTITQIPAGELKAANALAAQRGAELETSGKAAQRAPVNPTLGAVGGTLGEGGVGGPPATPVASCP